MTLQEKTQLQKIACEIRMLSLRAINNAKSGHPGGSLSIADIVAYLYFREMRIKPEDPKWEDRDRFVLSKGHCAPAVYAALGLRGYYPVEDMMTLRQIGSAFQGHPNMNLVPGIDMSTGSLGQGVSIAAGMAKAAKYLNKDLRVYTLLGDGEINEGQCWEAMMFAAHYKLDNLVVMVDNNDLQIDGHCADVMSPYPLDEKFRAFGFGVAVIDGHDFDAIEAALIEARATKGKPFAIVLKTVKGKGVSFMEDVAGWHGKSTNDEELAKALEELSAQLAELEG